jgi:hypothetical protein
MDSITQEIRRLAPTMVNRVMSTEAWEHWLNNPSMQAPERQAKGTPINKYLNNTYIKG